jgi:Dolichyl-phosphate-mannose-protein mannosyltransferase
VSLKLILAASAGLAAWLGWRSLGWPLIHDAPIMHYIAWLIAEGAVPYRDAFDMNLPGVYLIHWAVLAVGGAGDRPWRLFDLGWLAATCALLFVYCRPAGDRWAAASAATIFALYHLSGGAWRAGQRDFLLCLFLLMGALGVARSLEHACARGPLIAAGLALGAGIMIKPQAGAFWIACAVVAAWGAARQGRSAAAGGAAAVLAAGLVVPAIVMGWLAWRGGLWAFVAILTGYVAPLYGHVGRVRVWEALGWYPYGWHLWALWAAIVALALLGPAPEGGGARKGLALLGVAYGWLHFQIQGKGWEYHLYPLALFLTALLPFAVTPVPAAARERAALELRRAAALAAAAALVVTLGAKGVDAMDAPWIAAKARRVAALARDLRPLAPPGATVQVMDVAEGGIHALLELERRQPTRFIYDFHFFHDETDPRIRALRSEFMMGLETGRPAAIVVLKESWNRPGYDRLRELPGLQPLLDRAYILAVDGDGYRIYAKRTDS